MSTYIYAIYIFLQPANFNYPVFALFPHITLINGRSQNAWRTAGSIAIINSRGVTTEVTV